MIKDLREVSRSFNQAVKATLEVVCTDINNTLAELLEKQVKVVCQLTCILKSQQIM